MTSTVYGGDVTSHLQVTWSSSWSEPPLRYWTLVLVVIPALTLFGNALVVLSVCREAALRTATNYFIVSLAVADIMVAVLVMPLAVYVEVCRVCRSLLARCSSG